MMVHSTNCLLRNHGSDRFSSKWFNIVSIKVPIIKVLFHSFNTKQITKPWNMPKLLVYYTFMVISIKEVVKLNIKHHIKIIHT